MNGRTKSLCLLTVLTMVAYAAVFLTMPNAPVVIPGLVLGFVVITVLAGFLVFRIRQAPAIVIPVVVVALLELGFSAPVIAIFAAWSVVGMAP